MRSNIEPDEVIVTDGQRPIGMICPRDRAFEAHAADGKYLGKHATIRAARAALIKADKQKRGAA